MKIPPVAGLLVRTATTLGLGALLISKLDVGDTLALLGRMGSRPFIISTVVLALSALLTAPRWQLVLKCYGVAASFSSLFQLSLVGNFFNQVLPSSLGGDAVRIWRLSRDGIAIGTAAHSVIVDRLFGLVGMSALVALSLPFIMRETSDFKLHVVLLSTVAAAAASVFALVFAPRFRAMLSFLRPLRFFFNLADGFREVLRTPHTLVPCIVLTFIANFLPVIGVAAIGHSLAVPLSPLAYVAIVPASLIISLIPVSIAGWGVREVAMVVCMAPFNVPPETALAVSVAFGIALTLSALPGGFVWLMGFERLGGGQSRLRK